MRFIKAVKIFDGKKFLPPGIVLVYGHNGTLEGITGEREVAPENTEHFDGILTPGFINTHCHLELSHLKSQVSKGGGFCAFAIELMDKRGKSAGPALEEAMLEAEKEMIGNGIVAVGDISNGETSFKVKAGKKLHYHTFVELIGLNPSAAQTILEKGELLLQQLSEKKLSGSLAAHAPYSVSRELIALISAKDTVHTWPFSIHNQETIEEQLFFMGEKSQVHDLYRHLNIDVAFYKPPCTSSLADYLPALCGKDNILVHNTFTSEDDIKAAERKNVHWCFCPSANLYIENRLPEFKLFCQAAARICIGTDSLASNTQLNVLAELNLLAEACDAFSEESLLAMVTSNGARALGIENTYWKLVIGGQSGLNLVRNTGNKFQLIKRIF